MHSAKKPKFILSKQEIICYHQKNKTKINKLSYVESEHDYPTPQKGFTMSGFDEQKCVGKITDFLNSCKKRKSLLV